MRTRLPDTLAGEAREIAETALRACVHCGMCNATCPTYQLTGEELMGPRGRIYLMKQALEGEPVTELTREALDACLGCRACETTCPSGVQYHRLFEVGQAAVLEAAPRPATGRLQRAAIRALALSPAFGMLSGLGRALRPLLPGALKDKVPPPPGPAARPPVRHQRRMVLLTGCVQSGAAPHFNAVAARILDQFGITLVEAPQAGCCGAVPGHLDARDQARTLARRNLDAWAPHLEDGAEAVLVTSSGCGTYLHDYPDLLRDDPAYLDRARRLAALVRDPVEVLETLPLAAAARPAQPRIAVHEPCSLQHGLKLAGRIPALLRRLGYDPQPVADSHLCCGSAGAWSLLNPEMAGRLRDARLEALHAGEPAAVYTANIGCWMHLSAGAPAPLKHWLEAVEDVLPRAR
ncbi:MAG: glycolate oxidase subunit GlcF [Phenylobacterium sp.]